MTRRRKATAALATAAVVVLGAGVAQAAWLASGTGSGSSKAAALGVPSGGAAGSATTSSLALSWTAPSTGVSPTGYTVLRSTTSGSGYAAIASGGCSGTVATTSCTDSGLAAGTQYFYVVAATRGAWTSANSTEFSGTTTAAVTAAPVITGLKDAASDTGSSASDGVTKNQTPTIVGTHATNGATVTVKDGTTALGTTTVVGGAWQFTPSSSLAESTHSITATATVNSITSVPSNAYTIVVDVTAPPAPSVSTATTSNNQVDVTFSDAEVGVSFVCNFDGGTYTSCVSPKHWGPGSGFDGLHNYGVKAVDVAGNESTATVKAQSA